MLNNNWLIGKDSLTITVPVTEEGSGADNITYTVTPEGGTADTKTGNITDGKAEITLSADFKGTVSIVCTDKAGNTSADVTVGTGLGANGIIIEGNAPQIAFQEGNVELVQPGEYKTAPSITVTVTDGKDGVISGGIASVSYKIGNEKTVSHDYTTGMVTSDSFTIPADEIPAGKTVISVTATDHAGNSSTGTHTVSVHTHSVKKSVPAKPATCTEAGNIEHYICACGKYFSDSSCADEITDQSSVTIQMLGHDFSGQYLYDETHHWKVCSRCEEMQDKEEHKFDNEADRDCNVCGYERTIEVSGNVSKDVEKDEKAPDTALSTSAKELADIILTEEEKAQVDKNGTDIKFILDVKDAADTVNSSDKAAVQETLSENDEVKGFSIGQYLDISLFKLIGTDRSAISQTSKKLMIVIDVPDSLKGKDSGKVRTFAIIRVHDGEVEILEDLDDADDTITIATDRFSAYAIVFSEAGSGGDVTPGPTATPEVDSTPSPTVTPEADSTSSPTATPGVDNTPSPTATPGADSTPSPTATPEADSTSSPTATPEADNTSSLIPTPTPEVDSTPGPIPDGGKEKRKAELHSGLKAAGAGEQLQITWGRVSGADGYSVYVQYCGEDFSAKSLNQVKNAKKTKITVKKVNGKKLDTTRNFKLYVVAWKWKDGKKKTIAKTIIIHVAGKDSVSFTNVKKIQVKKSSYTLKKGAVVTLRPKALLYDKRKKQLSAAHCNEFRYLSSNTKVAMVTAGGTVKAKGTGECTIYVFARNGCKRKIKIKV